MVLNILPSDIYVRVFGRSETVVEGRRGADIAWLAQFIHPSLETISSPKAQEQRNILCCKVLGLIELNQSERRPYAINLFRGNNPVAHPTTKKTLDIVYVVVIILRCLVSIRAAFRTKRSKPNWVLNASQVCL